MRRRLVGSLGLATVLAAASASPAWGATAAPTKPLFTFYDCGTKVSVFVLIDHTVQKVTTDSQGNRHVSSKGKFVVRFAGANGRHVRLDVSGATENTYFKANGDDEFAATGANVVISRPESKRFGLPRAFYSLGPEILLFNKQGNLINVTRRPPHLIGLCMWLRG